MGTYTRISKHYIITPGLADPLQIVKRFVEMAKSKGTKRFVLLTSKAIEKGGLLEGKVHERLADSAEVECCVIRPT